MELAHKLYKQGNYSGSIKFANSVYEETIDKEIKFNVLSFLCNSFVALGQLDESKKLLKKIQNQLSQDVDLELKAHLLKLEGHLLFNNEKWDKANLLYKESFKILDSLKSRYKNEVLFYFYLNLLFIDTIDKNLISNKKLIKDDYRILIDCILLLVSNQKINNNILDRVNQIKKNQLKSYGFWIISKYYAKNNMVDKSYRYETLAQETLKISSHQLSDSILRENFLKNLIIHAKILSETSVQIDDLIDVSDVPDSIESDSSIIYNNELVFNYCVSCGQENINKNIQCSSCSTNLSQSSYE